MTSPRESKQYRAIGHRLRPVVTVAGKGLSEGVMQELERALCDHELIKVKLVVGSREARRELGETICERTGAELDLLLEVLVARTPEALDLEPRRLARLAQRDLEQRVPEGEVGMPAVTISSVLRTSVSP